MASSSSSARRAARRRPAAGAPEGAPVFTKRNYVLLGIGLALIIVGYVLMRAENEVDGPLSLFVAPILLLAGYLEVIYAILWRPRRESATANA